MQMKYLSLMIAGLLCACSSPPRKYDPELAVPAAWRNAQSGEELPQIQTEWWATFGNPELSRLIARAQAGSNDLAAAVARVEQARAAAVIAGAPLLPEVNARLIGERSDYLGSTNRNRIDTKTVTAGLSASYEIDFWGRTRALRDAGLAGLQASEFDRDTVHLTVTSSVARTWLQTVGLRERVAIAQLNLDNAQAGAASPLELAQQQGLTAAQRRALAALKQQSEAAHASLATLLGMPPVQLELNTQSLAVAAVPPVRASLPGELLARRPDIAAAEARLQAADANITAARAALWPSLTLSVGVFDTAGSFSSIGENPYQLLGANLLAPIFNAGRLGAQRDLAVARQQELLAGYRAVVMTAFGETESVLSAINGLDAQRQAQAEELAQAQRAFELAELRYKAGAETLLTLLDTQRTLFAAQDLSVQLRLQRLQTTVDLYKVLGGGWQANGTTVSTAQGLTQ
jgi:NodT family efflux transporter outer membrane factor (OMF) lipoprotein